MKKIIGITAAIIILLTILFAVSVPIVNDITARNIERDLRNIPLPSDTEVIDSLSKAEKLVGNGNGMQYLGALLLKSSLSKAELQAHYEKYYSDVYAEAQNGSSLSFLDHVSLRFEYDVPQDGGYYVVYAWGSGLPIYRDLDIRGH